MASITTRAGKGASLSWNEADANFINLNTELAAHIHDAIDAHASSAISYLPAGTGAVATDVQTKLREAVSVKDFGGSGDGVSNDATPLANAISAASGRVLDGGGMTYKVNTGIACTAENIVIQNMVIDASGITTGGNVLSFSGTQGSPRTLTANTLTGSNTITVSSTSGFSAEQYAWLGSTTAFWASGGAVLGQMVKIKSVDSATNMTLYDDVLYDFTTASTASISPLTMKSNITFRNVRIIGAGSGLQTGICFDKCSDITVDCCDIKFVDYVAIAVTRCVNTIIHDTAMRYARSVGLSYGVAIGNGSYSTKIANCYGEDQRHMVTVGDNDGINLFVTVTGCHATMQRDAGIDSHPPCDFMVIDGNTVELVGENTGDGIIFQGLNCVITDNAIIGNIGVGIRHQVFPDIGSASSVISGNSITNVGGTVSTDSGIIVAQETNGTTTLDGVVISGNKLHGAMEYGMYVYARKGNIKNVSINGNVYSSIASNTGCYIRADHGKSIEDFAITGNVFKCSGTQNVYLGGTTAPNILNGVVSGNTIKGGIYGIRYVQCQNVVETGNYNTGSTHKNFIATGSKFITLDRRTSSVVTITNSTYVVLDQDEYLIANRAGTITVTLPIAADHPGRVLNIKTVQAQTVVSAISDVVAITGTTADTAILPATDGAWALLKSDGSNWNIMQS